MACNKNNNKKQAGTLAGLDEWCTEHWFITFLLVSSALGVVGSVVTSLSNK